MLPSHDDRVKYDSAIEILVGRAGKISGVQIERLTVEVVLQSRTNPRWTFEISALRSAVRIAYAYGCAKEAYRDVLLPSDDLDTTRFSNELYEAILSLLAPI